MKLRSLLLPVYYFQLTDTRQRVFMGVGVGVGLVYSISKQKSIIGIIGISLLSGIGGLVLSSIPQVKKIV